MSTEPIIPPAADPAESSAIRQMRERINELNDEVKNTKARAEEAEAKLTTAERAKLDELERVRLEAEEYKSKVTELSPLAARVEQYEARFKGLYEAEFAKIPEAVRPQAEQMLGDGSFSERFERLRGIQGMIQTLTPIQEGNRTQPPAATSAPVPPTDGGKVAADKPMTFEEARAIPWNKAMMDKMPGIDLSKAGK